MTTTDELPDRLASVREAAGRMEEALRDEGFEEHGSHAIFVQWQRQTVEGLGAILLHAEKAMGERVEKACGLMDESSRKFRDDEFRRAEILLNAGRETLNMARQAAETAASASERAEKAFDSSVAKIARELSRKLLDESQQWLVLKQTQRNRRDARRFAVMVALAAFTLFGGGYAAAEWRNATDRTADEAVLSAVERCWLRPIMLQDVKGQPIAMCRLQDIDPKGG